MRIGIDARWIFPQLTGVGIYTQELIRHLVRVDTENQYLLFFDHAEVEARTAQATGFRGVDRFRVERVDYGPFSWKSQLLLPGLWKRHGLDVFHSTNYAMPLLCRPAGRARRRTARVVTVHDLIPLVLPDHAPRSKKARLFPLYRRLMLEIGRRADLIIAVSESSRRDVIEHLRVPPARQEKVVTVYEAAGRQYRPDPARRAARPTLLYVGRLDPYKNVPVLIEALAGLLREGFDTAVLRMIGPDDPRYPEARIRARELGVEKHIEWMGAVSGDELVHAYQEAHLLALPTRYEGFGLTVLEAMACGTPVVCSRCSSLPEVAGDAALMVAPGDVEGLTRAMARVLSDPEQAAGMRQRGLEQARRFHWDRTARETVAAYQSAVAP